MGKGGCDTRNCITKDVETEILDLYGLKLRYQFIPKMRLTLSREESSTEDDEEDDVADDDNSEIEKNLTDSDELDSNEATGDEELETEESHDRTNESPQSYDHILSNANVRSSDTESESDHATEKCSEGEDQERENERSQPYDHLLLNSNISTSNTRTPSTNSASSSCASTIHVNKTRKQRNRINYISQEDLDHQVKKIFVLMQIYRDRCAMVHSGCQDMDAQSFCDHLTYLKEKIEADSFIFKQPDAKEFVLEAIDEYWDWYFWQDKEGTWYYEDKSERIKVNIRGEDGGEEGVVEKDVGDEGET